MAEPGVWQAGLSLWPYHSDQAVTWGSVQATVLI